MNEPIKPVQLVSVYYRYDRQNLPVPRLKSKFRRMLEKNKKFITEKDDNN